MRFVFHLINQTIRDTVTLQRYMRYELLLLLLVHATLVIRRNTPNNYSGITRRLLYVSFRFLKFRKSHQSLGGSLKFVVIK
jgi:hypothetical protein